MEKKKNRGKYLEPGIKVISVNPSNRILLDSSVANNAISSMMFYDTLNELDLDGDTWFKNN